MFFKQKSFLITLHIAFVICSAAYDTSVLEIIENGCKPTGIFCKTSTSFTFCTKIGADSLLIINEFFCPEGYFCNTQTKYPCVSAEEPPQLITTEEMTQSIITEETTQPTITEEITETGSASTTTKKPVEMPICLASGFHPGPSCSQYYECVSSWWWAYDAVLRTCTNGLYFSTTTKTCVELEASGCVD